MLSKRLLLRAKRLRRIPSRFSWLDQRLVRDGHLRELSAQAGMLYLFLVTVSDCHGVSWYSARRICLEIGMEFDRLAAARSELVERDLIAFDDGLYQVLELPKPAKMSAGAQSGCSGLAPGERAATAEEVNAIVAQFRQSCGSRGWR